MFKSFQEKSFALHKRTTGQEARGIQGVPVKHRGKVLDGGYFPLNYQRISDDVKITKFINETEKKLSAMSGLEDGKLFGQLKAAEMTEQGRFEERTVTGRPLDLNINNFFNGLEEVVHDLSFRETGIDTLKLLKNPVLAKSIKATVGQQKYKVMVNTVIETIGKTNERNENFFSEEWRFTNTLMRKAEAGHAVATLGLNLSSIAMQPISLTTMALRMGPKGTSHILKTAVNLSKNMHMMDEFVNVAVELNRDINFGKDAIDDTLVQGVFDFIPGTQTFLKKHTKSASVFSTIKEAQKTFNDFALSGLGEADRTIKIIETLSAASEFFAGDVPNFPNSRLKTMTEAQKIKAAKSYVKQVADLALTTSAPEDKVAIEKLALTKIFTKYWTDGRSQLNTNMAVSRKIKWGVKKAKESFEGGDKRQAAREATDAAGNLMKLAIVSSIVKLYVDLIRGNETPFDEAGDLRTEDDWEQFSKETFMYFTKSIPENFVELTPAVRDMSFAYHKKTRSDTRNVQVPLFKVLSDLTLGAVGLADSLELAVEGELDLESMSPKRVKAMLYSASYLTGGFAVNGMSKFKKFLDNEDVLDTADRAQKEMKRLNKSINSFIDKFKDKPSAQQYIENLKKIQTELIPQFDQDTKEVIPEDVREVLKTALSEGEWNAFNPDTGAAGVYQFTEERWNEVADAAPNLGLTENGRVSKDARQQEKAMSWSIQDNTRGLIAFDIPVNNQTLYGVHKFGFDNYVSIHDSKSNEKLTKVLGNEVKNNPLFKEFKTVRSVKDHISSKIEIDKN